MADRFSFYEGNNGTQNLVFTIDATKGFDGKAPVNDEARSVRLTLIPANYILEVYDSPSASESDDFAFIVTKTTVPDYTVNTFEQNISNEYIDQIFFRNNGLDGKISYIRAYQSTSSNALAEAKAKFEEQKARRSKK
eukprot:Phypoly_transcript_17921.p1 GENE.Phypoly_transcript_17921~~Phypoly_transcript_17921.p1  ORF type:complete len:137 (+),score=28.45 Phypoly_transcript_17921:167-577(+)